jgi:hypothetical protein
VGGGDSYPSAWVSSAAVAQRPDRGRRRSSRGSANDKEIAATLWSRKERHHQTEPEGHGETDNDRREEPRAAMPPIYGCEKKGGRGQRVRESRAPCHHHPSGPSGLCRWRCFVGGVAKGGDLGGAAVARVGPTRAAHRSDAGERVPLSVVKASNNKVDIAAAMHNH